MMPLLPRSSARTLKILSSFVAAAAIAVGCGSEPAGHSIFTGSGDPSGGGGSDPSGGGGSTGSNNPTTGAGNGATSGAGQGSSSSGGVQQATFTVALEAAAVDIDLATSIGVNVTVKPNGYKGDVTLSVTDPGPDVTAKLQSTKVTLDGATDAITKLTFNTVSKTAPGDIKFTVSGVVSNGTKTADGTLTVHSAITITIPSGVDGMSGTATFGAYPTTIIAPAGISNATPVTVRFFNADNKSHQVHAGNNAQGFPHDPGPIAPNSMDNQVRNVNAKGTYDYYLHDEGSPINQGRIVIQ